MGPTPTGGGGGGGATTTASLYSFSQPLNIRGRLPQHPRGDLSVCSRPPTQSVRWRRCTRIGSEAPAESADRFAASAAPSAVSKICCRVFWKSALPGISSRPTAIARAAPRRLPCRITASAFLVTAVSYTVCRSQVFANGRLSVLGAARTRNAGCRTQARCGVAVLGPARSARLVRRPFRGVRGGFSSAENLLKRLPKVSVAGRGSQTGGHGTCRAVQVALLEHCQGV